MTKTCKKAYKSLVAKNNVLSLRAIDIPLLKGALCIYYLLYFNKDQVKVQTWLDSNTEINTMAPAYAANLSFKIRSTNMEAQKIESFTLLTLAMALANFKINDKLSQSQFF